MSILAFGMPGGYEILVMLFVYPAFFVIPVIAFWRICSKAGFPGELGLLMLVPLANIVLPLYLALAEWPALGKKDASSKQS
jgi:hypothetical protein